MFILEWVAKGLITALIKWIIQKETDELKKQKIAADFHDAIERSKASETTKEIEDLLTPPKS